MNPFSKEYSTPFQSIPFSKINLSHYKEAIDLGIAQAKKEIDAIIHLEEAASFENTILPLEQSGKILSRVTSAFFNLNSADTNSEMQAIAQDISPLLTAHGNDIMMNETLFRKVREVFEEGKSDLNKEQKMLLKKTYLSFVRNGANLNDTAKDRLRGIDAEKAKLSLTFGENVLKESNAFQLLLDDKKDLEGLPEGIIEAAKNLASAKGEDGKWMFTLDYPSYIPFMTYSSHRNLRKQMYHAFGSKGFADNENNNTSIIKRLVELRHERAKLLGFESHAHYVLTERMAKDPKTVLAFLDDIKTKAEPAAKREFLELKNYANSLDGIDDLEKWDASYYAEKLKKERFNIDDEALRPYFKLENVVAGVFLCAQKLFGIHFNKREDIDVYHEDVVTYEVLNENGEHVALFYADFFPREGKRQGAWMTSFRSQCIENDEDRRPHVSIVCNFTKPSSTKPSLLTFNEVTTLFHEFGHALHGILAKGTYASLSGTSVYWDFVELPSQIMENWCYEKECLDLFAKHYETGETIPNIYIERIKESSNFMAGMGTLRQIGLGKLDMAWHSGQFKGEAADVKAFEEAQLEGLSLYPPTPNNCTSTSFSHIFQGGYSSGYYSYKWAEVLDADAFEAFQEAGIFNKEVASSFKENILSKGGTEHPSLLYKRFRGRNATPDALLKRAGLV